MTHKLYIFKQDKDIYLVHPLHRIMNRGVRDRSHTRRTKSLLLDIHYFTLLCFGEPLVQIMTNREKILAKYNTGESSLQYQVISYSYLINKNIVLVAYESGASNARPAQAA